MIDISLLRYVLAAADTGSFSRAASQFGMKQSTLSKHVQYLELRLGLPLFRRTTRGVHPTDPGQAFLARALRIVQEVDALVCDSRALARGDAGSLKLGFHASLVSGDLASTFQAFRAACPEVEIVAQEADRTQLLDALERGRLDLAVLGGIQTRPVLRSRSLWSAPLAVALPADHALAAQEILYWTDLRAQTFLLSARDPGPDIAAVITSRLSAPGHAPRIILQDITADNLLSFVGEDRLAIATGFTQPNMDDPGAAVLRPVHDAFGRTMLEQGLHWHPSNANPTLKRFLDFAARRYGQHVAEKSSIQAA